MLAFYLLCSLYPIEWGSESFSVLSNEGRKNLVHAVDVVHALAVLTVALLAARFLQAIGEHYFPDSEALTAARFIYGGP
jgi:hypothetical protein